MAAATSTPAVLRLLALLCAASAAAAFEERPQLVFNDGEPGLCGSTDSCRACHGQRIGFDQPGV